MKRDHDNGRDEALWRALAAGEAPRLRGSLYPGIARRLRGRPSPWARAVFAGGAVAALLVGLLVGERLGEPHLATAAPSSPLVSEGVALTDEGGEPTLADIYLSVAWNGETGTGSGDAATSGEARR